MYALSLQMLENFPSFYFAFEVFYIANKDSLCCGRGGISVPGYFRLEGQCLERRGHVSKKTKTAVCYELFFFPLLLGIATRLLPWTQIPLSGITSGFTALMAQLSYHYLSSGAEHLYAAGTSTPRSQTLLHLSLVVCSPLMAKPCVCSSVWSLTLFQYVSRAFFQNR